MKSRPVAVPVRWRLVIVALGVCATAATASFVVHSPGVYHQQVDVAFLRPKDQAGRNAFQYGSSNLIRTAGIVGRIVGSADAGPGLSSDDATLIGTGATHGFTVRLPNSGGQWAYNFDRPVLDVQVVGRSTEEVAATMATVLAKIDATLLDQQEGLGVRPASMVRTQRIPEIPRMDYSNGSHLRALVLVLALGAGITAAGSAAVGREVTRRRLPVAPERGAASLAGSGP
jgi:hypothetical protein